jgi:hypothetical protein
MLSTLNRFWSRKFLNKGRVARNRGSNSCKAAFRPVRLSMELLEERTLLSTSSLGAAYGQVPLSFEPNVGQTNDQFNFLSRGSGYTLLLNSQEAVFSLQSGQTDVTSSPASSQAPGVLRMQLVGANPAAAATGLDRQEGISNYFLGNNPSQWHTNVPNFAQTQFQGVYPGVDVVYYGNQSQLEYDFIVAPGADPSNIQLRFDGAQGIDLDSGGNLVLHTAGGDVVEHAPVLYQEASGIRHAVAGNYVIEANGQVGFQVGAYDTTRTLTIDPVLTYSTYLGGSNDEAAVDIVVNSAGEAYFVGNTKSTNFPIVDGYQSSMGSASQVGFIAKLNAAGTALVYSTFLGGDGASRVSGIALDSSDNAYVVGDTSSTNFPTLNAIQSINSNRFGTTGFVTKLNAAGSALVYSTYLGGNGQVIPDYVYNVAVDSLGNAYVVGDTGSTNFPTVNAIQPSKPGSSSGFVAEIDATGSSLVFSTYLGGSRSGGASVVALDKTGAIYVGGPTSSPDFPITADALQPTFHGPNSTFEGYLTRLSPGGTSIEYSTFFGGSDVEFLESVKFDSAGNIYLGGVTYSTDFPTVNAFQSTLNGGQDAFVAKIDAASMTLDYSTYLGGDKYTASARLAVDSAGNAIVVGSTSSTNFPTLNAFQTTNAGTSGNFSYDAFISRLDSSGALTFSTYLGGSNDLDGLANVALDNVGTAYLIGYSNSPDFPTLNALQSTNPGGQSALIVKIDMNSNSPVPVLTALSNQSAGQGISTSFTLGAFSEFGVNGPWNVEVNWGDGTANTTFTVNAAGSLGTKTHTYASAGSDTVTVKVTDSAGKSGSATFSVTVFAPPVLTAPSNQAAGQGIATTFDLGTFTQPGVTGTWSIVVNWGDGSANTTFSVTAPGALGTKSHTYAAAGIDTVTVTLTDPFGNKDAKTFTVTVSAPPLLTAPSNQSAGQGITTAFLLGAFSQPGVTGTWNIVVSWGDGTSDTTFSVNSSGSLGTKSHAYTSAGSDTVTITVTDPLGYSGSTTFTVAVFAPPVLTAPTNQLTGQGVNTSFILGSFSQPGVTGTWSIVVNWGDGTSDTSFTTTAAGSLGTKPHAYVATGTDTVTVTVTDPFGNAGSDTFAVDVFPTPVVTPPANQLAGLGIATGFTLGTFSESNVSDPWNVVINWGDGTPNTTFIMSAQGSLGAQPHTFGTAGAETVTITVTDLNGISGSAAFSVAVFAPPVLTAASNQSAGQGIAAAVALGSFSQSGVTGTWNVAVNWGDASPNTTFTASATGSLGTQSHVFNTPGSDTVTVTVTDAFGNSDSESFTESVFAPPVLTAPADQAAGQGLTTSFVLGSFSQPGVTGSWSVEVNWGDGTANTTSAVTASGSLGSKPHAYNAAGPDTVTVTVTDAFGNSDSESFSVSVFAPPLLTAPGNQTARQGIATDVALGSFSQPGVTGPWNIQVDWGDGTPVTTSSVSTTGSLGTQSHTYNTAGSKAATVTVTDPYGNTDTETFTVSIFAPPLLTGASSQAAGQAIATKFALGSFSQVGGTGPWNVQVNWGDGTPNITFSASAPGSLGTQIHTYSTAGADTVTITVTDAFGISGSTTFNVSVFAPPVLTAPTNQSTGRGISTPFVLGSFLQTGFNGPWNVTVHWGDGAADTTFSDSAQGYLGTKVHTFSAAGTKTVTVTVADPFGNSGSIPFTVAVFDPPVLTAPGNQSAGQSLNTALALGSFSQPGVTGPWKVEVNWGDGAALTTFSAGMSGSLGTQPHAYASAGTDTVTVTLTDLYGNLTSDTFSVSVSPPPVVTPPANQSAGRGNAAAFALGSFSQLDNAGPWSVEVNWGDGTAHTTFSATASGSLGTQTHTYSAAGTDTVTVSVTDSNGITGLAMFTVSANATPVTLGPASLPGDTINVAYQQTITASGGTGNIALVVSNVQNAIAGLHLPGSGANTIAITGTPTATGTETFTVTATDQLGATVQTDFSITVNPVVTLGPDSLPADTINVAYQQTITVSGGTGNIALVVSNVQNAIAGLNLPGTGVNTIAITGTPTATGTETFTVTATDDLGVTAQTNYSITVNPALTLSPSSLPAGSVNDAYNQTITASGGTGDITLVVSNVQNAIAGLPIPGSGVHAIAIAGTPTATGTETFTVTATDEAGGMTQTNFSITSSGAALTVTISGVVFFDQDSSGVLNAGEIGLAGRTVFLDLNNTGQPEPGDPSAVTAADGSFQFAGLTPGAYTVREAITNDNVALTSPASATVTATGDVNGINFGSVIYNPAFPVYPTADLNGSQLNPDPATAYVTGLYHAILGRNPDPGGLAFWVNAMHAGVPDSEVASVFVNSREHSQNEVGYYYETFLGRAPDPASAFWVEELIHGGSEANVIESILTSPEYTAAHSSNLAFVSELYFQLLGRQADKGGAAFWEKAFNSGISRSEVVERFLDSQESADLAIASFYAAFLHRAGDQAGKAYWAGKLTSQAQTFGQVAADFFSAPPKEFLSKAGQTGVGDG